jgi:glycosyltransferase involved in cell wall biosynthesis
MVGSTGSNSTTALGARTLLQSWSKTMRLGVQAFLWSQAGSYRQSGVSNYIRHLVRGLGEIAIPGEALVYLPTDDPLPDFPRVPSLQSRVSPFPLRRPSHRILWEHTGFPFMLWRDQVDLLHATMNVAPWWTPCPVVVTIHDLAYMRYPQVHPRGRRMYLSPMTHWTVRRARSIIAVSEYTRLETERLLGVPRERIHVIYEGVDGDFCPLPQDQIADFRRRQGLPSRYLLYVGNLEPRKNLVRLVQAFAHLREHHRIHLVLAGARGWDYARIFQMVEELSLVEQVHFPGFVKREELPLWYNGAEAFVYPSLYEGFGLPPLEAMACGTPVVVSTAASLPEVVGDAGLQVSPTDVAGLVGALERLLLDDGLRLSLRERGLARSRSFTWERMAQQTVNLYRDLMPK